MKWTSHILWQGWDKMVISYDIDVTCWWYPMVMMGETWRWQSIEDWNITTTPFTASQATWLQCRMPFRFFGYSWLFFLIFLTYACHPTKTYSVFWWIFTPKKSLVATSISHIIATKLIYMSIMEMVVWVGG
jgi:hypothetical protein